MGEKIREHFEGEPKPEYNFELMKEIEPAMISLVQQMKQGIEEGRWSSMLSDDVGGRIPSLVLRKILQEKGPERDVKAYFLAAGQGYMPSDMADREDYDEWDVVGRYRGDPEPTATKKEPERYEKVKKYLAGLNFGDKRVLIVTEYAFKGKTIEKIGLAMQDAGVDNKFDLAIAHNSGFSDVTRRLEAFECMSGSEIFIGKENYSSHFSEGHKGLSGVRKEKEYSPVPIKTLKKIKKEGAREFTKEEMNQIFGISEKDTASEEFDKLSDPEKVKEYERRRKEPLTAEEEKEMQVGINLAREDVNKMVKRVIEQVWK